MSYNCDSWKTKAIEDLRIPMASFFKHSRTDWHPEPLVGDDGFTVIGVELMESTISGTVEDGILMVKDIDISGEGSGTALGWIFRPAFEDSTGKFSAVTVWEGGDSICRITVEDGVYKEEQIEL